jgi:hypothetical protein
VMARELRKTLGTRLAKNNSFIEPAFPLACGGISFSPHDKGNAGSENEIEPKRVHYGKLVAGPRLSNPWFLGWVISTCHLIWVVRKESTGWPRNHINSHQYLWF